MTNAEAVGTVHRMMEACEQEEARTAALASQVDAKKYDPGAARQKVLEGSGDLSADAAVRRGIHTPYGGGTMTTLNDILALIPMEDQWIYVFDTADRQRSLRE